MKMFTTIAVFCGGVLAVGLVSCTKSDAPQKSINVTNASQPAAKSYAAKHASFYSCGMHPEVRSLDPEGKCPDCQMPLLPGENVQVMEPDTGKTNNAASYPVVSGYYSCPAHRTVLSQDPDEKCPICKKPLLPVENPIFIQDK